VEEHRGGHDHLNSEIGVTRALAVNEAGEIARKRVERLVNEFRVLITRVIKIEYEILQGEKGTLEEDVKSESQSDARAVREGHQQRPHRRRTRVLAVHGGVLA
jgi:hypothetical protein